MKIKDKNLYYVGGVVRDEILGLPSLDTDFCYVGNAIEFAQKFNIIKTNPDFGTVRIQTEIGEVDIASTRTEYYPRPGHLPVVGNIGCSLEDDLKRRDFTINSLAKNTVTGKITDFFGGLQDIKEKKLRVLHDKSFVDDPTRIVRALKFSVRFNFLIDSYTKQLQEKYLKNINYDMSYHRLKKELKETFNLNNENAYKLFITQGIYKLLGENQEVPKIKTSISELIERFKPTHIWLVYLGLFNLSKLELSTQEKNIINTYNDIKNKYPKNDLEIYKLFKNAPLESVLLYAIGVDYQIVLRYLEKVSKIKIEISSLDLQSLGIKQGKIYSEIFNYILEQKINTPTLTKAEEINLVRKTFCNNG